MGTAMAGIRRSVTRPEPAGEAHGADAAVELLFRTQRLQLVRLARLLVDDKETAEDVVQDAFAALHRRWGSLSSPDAAGAYLRTSVVNTSRSTLRRRRTARASQWHGHDSLIAESADQPTMLAAEHREVLDALRRLPQRQREVIVLRYWAELGEAEIARTLGISVGAVKSSASRGRDAIAVILRSAERGGK
jgi:RNA polymerase sigma-70 factor (sigma-E family)